MTGLVSRRAFDSTEPNIETAAIHGNSRKPAFPIHLPLIPVYIFKTPTAPEDRHQGLRNPANQKTDGFTVAPWTLKEHRNIRLSGQILQYRFCFTRLEEFSQATKTPHLTKRLILPAFRTFYRPLRTNQTANRRTGSHTGRIAPFSMLRARLPSNIAYCPELQDDRDTSGHS